MKLMSLNLLKWKLIRVSSFTCVLIIVADNDEHIHNENEIANIFNDYLAAIFIEDNFARPPAAHAQIKFLIDKSSLYEK